jgi:hypothetical protein
MTEITLPTIGRALYLELRRENSTNQIIVIPEGMTTTGRYVPMSTYRRRISESQPRKTWRAVTSLFRTEIDPSGEKLVKLAKDHALATVDDRMGYNLGLFNQLINAGFKVHGQPFVVDVTREDMDDVWNGKTPYKILARITRSRKALNFGDALWAESPST